MTNIILFANMEYGLIVTLVGYSIVLLALSFLVAIYLTIPKLLNAYTRQKLKREGKKCAENDSLQLSGDESAAIATAVFFILNEHHDLESGTITINRVIKSYSPWSSKIYSMNNYQR